MTVCARVRCISWVTSLAFLSYLAFFIYSMATGKERMTEVCRQISPGMTIEQLTKLAEEHGLGPRHLNAGMKLAYLGEKRTIGRHACRVELEAGIVKRAIYNYAD